MSGLASMADSLTNDNFDFDSSGELERAERAARAAAEGSARESIELQEKQIAGIEDLTAPFRETALTKALPALISSATGFGEIDYQPSQLFQRQLETGREGILRGQAGGGSLKSSGTFERLGDLVSGLAAEDIGRYETGISGLLNTGLSANEILSRSASELTGNVSAISSNLGQSLNLAQQRFGQSKAAGFESLSRGMSSIADIISATQEKDT